MLTPVLLRDLTEQSVYDKMEQEAQRGHYKMTTLIRSSPKSALDLQKRLERKGFTVTLILKYQVEDVHRLDIDWNIPPLE